MLEQANLIPETRPTLSGLDPRLSCPVLCVVAGPAMTRALDDHFGRGYEVESATDGWVLLRRSQHRLVLTTTPPAC